MSFLKAGVLVPLVAGLAACAGAGPSRPACDYASTEGDPFVFATTYAGGERFGYQHWRARLKADQHLPYEPYVGRKGKLTAEVISSKDHKYFDLQKAVLENCEIVYTEVSKSDPFYWEVYMAKDLEKANALIGKKIWINNAVGSRPSDLSTPDPKVFYPTHDREAVTVTGVMLEKYGHIRGASSFYLRVKNKAGEEGLLAFNTRYFFESEPGPSIASNQASPSPIRDTTLDEGLRMMQQGQDQEAAIALFAKHAAQGDIPALLNDMDPVARKAVGDEAIQQLLAGAVVPFFTNFQTLDGYKNVSPAQFPDGRTGLVHYMYIVTKDGTRKPMIIALINAGPSVYVVNVTVDQCVKERHPVTAGRCD